MAGVLSQSKHRLITASLLGLVIVLFSAAFSFAAPVYYFYDETNRLIMEDRDGTIVEYHYDEVGNLIAIITSTLNQSPPVLQGITPDAFPIGASTRATISGQNLITATQVTSDSPSLSVKILATTDTEIQAEVTTLVSSSPGPVTLTVTTLYGSADIQAAISSSILSFSPANVSLLSGTSTSITASLSPPVGQDLTCSLKNSDANIVSVSKTVVIPSSGSTSFNIDGLTAGAAEITSGDNVLPVSVIGSGLTATSKAVSVYRMSPTGTSTISSRAVSVYMYSSGGTDATISSPAVSVGIQTCLDPIRISDVSPVYYATLQAAYTAAEEGDTIQTRATEIVGDLTLDDAKSIILDGGYDCPYGTATGTTTLKGVLTIMNGTLTIANGIVIQ